MRKKTVHVRIGISGWRYEGWRGVFYPEDLKQARELDFASREVDTIEINGSHYSLQSLSNYQSWYEATPADFVFSVKGPRYLTHMLHGTETLYGGQYADPALECWASRIEQWAGGKEPDDAQRFSPTPAPLRKSRDVFCYFDNDKKVQAPFDAKRLMSLLAKA
ncbi:MAG TPA: DUF72 domain-containing protein [Paraburkholderia sp.]|nr:DUF72 domain-containing protein [Paraburkholderia sp.]